MAVTVFDPLLALIASATTNELAKYIEFLKVENQILRARIPGPIHSKPEERSRLIKQGKSLGQAIEELLALVSPSTLLAPDSRGEGGRKARTVAVHRPDDGLSGGDVTSLDSCESSQRCV